MKALLQLAGLAIAALFATLAFGDLSASGLSALLNKLKWDWLALALVSLGVDLSIRAARWWIMLRRFTPGVTYGSCISVFFATLALNNVLPLRAGDMARSFAFGDQLHTAPSQIAATLMLERLLDVMTLLLFFVIGLALLPVEHVALSVLTSALVPVLTVGLIILGVPMVMPMRFVSILNMIERKTGFKEDTLPARVISFLRNALKSLAPLHAPSLLVPVMGLSVVAWFFEGVIFLCVAIGIGLVDLGFGPWFSLSTSTLATMIPSTPGHVGTFDYFGKIGLMAYGVKPLEAAAHILICHVLTWTTITVLGGLYLLHIWGFDALARLRAARHATGPGDVQ